MGSYVDGMNRSFLNVPPLTNAGAAAGNRMNDFDTRLVREGIKTFQVYSCFLSLL